MRHTLTAILTLGVILTGDAAEPAAEAPKAKPYPLDTCIITGDKLDSMGGSVAMVHEGQEVKFCCKGCIKDFKKDTVRYIKKIDEATAAAKAKAKDGKDSAPAAHKH